MKDFLLLMAHATSDDINYQHKDKSGRAVLHVACVRGHASVVQILLWVRTISSQTTIYQTHYVDIGREQDSSDRLP